MAPGNPVYDLANTELQRLQEINKELLEVVRLITPITAMKCPPGVSEDYWSAIQEKTLQVLAKAEGGG